jgi:hypothetical protein
VAVAVAFTWFAPAHNVNTTPLIGVSNHQLVIRTTGAITLIPFSAVGTVTPVTVCG